jgi:subtilisin-like proprotein convertase family protein
MPTFDAVRKLGLSSVIAALSFAGGVTSAILPTPAHAAVAADLAIVESASSDRTQLTVTSRTTPPDAQGRYMTIVRFEGASLAAYEGGVPGLQATAPRARGESKLDPRAPHAQAYLGYLENRHAEYLAQIGSSLQRSVQPQFQYLNVFNGAAMRLTLDEAAKVAEMPFVRDVWLEELRELDTDVGPQFIGAPSFWNGETTSGAPNKGEGVVIGVIDSGFNHGHPSYNQVAEDSYVHINPYGDGVFRGACVANPSLCNNKLIAAYDLHPSALGPQDTNGHGTHTSSTAGGNPVVATFNGLNIPISGVAPRANLINYKVCEPSCPQASSIQAVNLAIGDMVDVLNYSISGSDSPWNDAVDLAFLDGYAAGIYISASAGNAGPGASTVAKTGPWNASVANIFHDRVFGFRLDLTMAGAPGNTQDITVVPGAAPINNVTLTNQPIIASPGFANGGTDGCSAFPAGTFLRNGTDPAIAVIHLDAATTACASGIRRTNALNAGASGVIFVDDLFLNLGASGTSWGMRMADWVNLAAHIATDANNATITITAPLGTRQGVGDIVNSGSSRGPSQYDLVKPDFGAPGTQVLAGYISSVNGGFNAISGTSMAAPHGAGAAALIIKENPGWSPSMVKSAIALTAQPQAMVKEDGSTPADPFDRGSGRIGLAGAARIPLVMDETHANFVAANPAIGGVPRNLNMPSIMYRNCVGGCTLTRTVTSVLADAQEYDVLTSAPAGVTVDVSPSNFTLAAGASQVLTIDVDFDFNIATPGEWNFGSIDLVPVEAARGAAVSFVANPNLPIPDNAYDGSLASMACSTIDTSSLPAGSTASNVRIEVAQSHTWIGDLTIKLQSPDSSILGVLSRPLFAEVGDNGTGCCGDSSNLLPEFPLTYRDGVPSDKDAELMGNGIGTDGVVCRDQEGGVNECNYFPNPGSVVGHANFAGFNGESAGGNWTLCIGDSEGGDIGTFASWTLTLEPVSGGATLPVLRMPVAVTGLPATPEISVEPSSITSTQATDEVTQRTLTISNSGAVDLLWSVDEAPAITVQLGFDNDALSGAEFAAKAGIGSSHPGPANVPVLPSGAMPSGGGAPINFQLDDGTSENNIGVGGATLVWLNRFTPSPLDFPIQLTQVQVLFNGGTAGINVGETVDIYVYTDADGNPANGATFVGSSLGVTVQALGSFSTYPVNMTLNGPGDVLIAVVNRTAGVTPGTFPAAIDQTASQGRSWAGFGAGADANPPTFPTETFGIIDSFGAQFAGNWMIRGQGTASASGCVTPADVPWLSVAPAAGTTTPGSSSNLTVTLDSTGLALGSYEALLCVASNDPVSPLVPVPVSLEVVAFPDIALSETSIEASLVAGTSTSETFDIQNLGGAPLNWTIDTAAPEGVALFGGGPLHDNGPFVTHPGGGPGGADGSVLQVTALGMTTLGASANLSGAGPHFRMADQFTATAPGWNVDRLRFYAYQTGSSTTSSFTGVNVRIWDGPPNDPASNIVFGDTTTNRISGTGWTGAYRYSDTAVGTTRPIMFIDAAVSVALPTGTYWVDWQLAGSIASGPWQPPITITGQAITGDSLQLVSTGWQPFVDTGATAGAPPQGLPFQVHGQVADTCDFPSAFPWLSVSPSAGTTAGGAASTVTVNFDSSGLAAGTHEAKICVYSNDPIDPLVSLPVTLEVLAAPSIELSVSDLSASAAIGSTTEQTFDIGNTGTGDLIWVVQEAEADRGFGTYGYAGRTQASQPVGAARGGQQPTGMAAGAILPTGSLPPVSTVTENFDDITLLPGAGWGQLNRSTTIGSTGWFQGNPATFPAHSGATNSYIGANFNNTTGVNTISNWLLTPEVELRNGTTLRFWTRTVNSPSFPDRLQVRLSTSGASMDVGVTSTDVGDFTELLLDINPGLTTSGYPNTWTEFEVTVSGLSATTTGRFALRYFVTGGGPSGSNSDYIGIDTLAVEQPPAACDNPTDVPWLSSTPSSGTTTPGNADTVTVTFDASALAIGSYAANLCILSNDPLNPTVELPVSFEVTQAAQTIDFGPLADRLITDSPFTVSATASSGLPVSFSSLTSSVCTVAGDEVTLVDAGTCTIRASQAGDATFQPAPNVDRSFEVIDPEITISPPTVPTAVIDEPYSVAFSASGDGSTGPFTFSVTGALPDGLSLSTAGVLSGTPTELGEFAFTITATDSTPAPIGPLSGSRGYTLTVSETIIFLDGFEPLPGPEGDVDGEVESDLDNDNE